MNFFQNLLFIRNTTSAKGYIKKTSKDIQVSSSQNLPPFTGKNGSIAQI